MRLVILTSNQLRHKYFINSLARNFNVVSVVMEEKKRDYSKKGEGTPLDSEVKKYFNDRSLSEQSFFGQEEKVIVPPENIISIVGGDLNKKEVAATVKKSQPDAMAVFGSSLLKEELIGILPPNRIINMHLGLSPYYRGSGTNFWPLYEEKPQYVGVTIHFIDIGIDSGDIIVQGRPNIEVSDTPHSIGNKIIAVGVDLVIKVLKHLDAGEEVIGHKQELKNGKLCLFKDCSPEHIIELTNKWQKGLIDKYLQKKDKIGNIKIDDKIITKL